MNLRGIVSVSGKPGLFKLIGQNKGGFVLESLDALKNKIVVNLSNNRMSSLEDITVYGDEAEIKLIAIFEHIHQHEAEMPAPKADGSTLRNFFRVVAEGHDEERVYASDMKKILNWYLIIKELPIFTEPAPEPLMAEEEPAAEVVETPKAPSKAKKSSPKAV